MAFRLRSKIGKVAHPPETAACLNINMKLELVHLGSSSGTLVGFDRLVVILVCGVYFVEDSGTIKLRQLQSIVINEPNDLRTANCELRRWDPLYQSSYQSSYQKSIMAEK